MKLEIGGGNRNRGEGWVNVDLCESADVKHDLNVTPWPFESGSVDELYSSHCIEHVKCPIAFLREVARICKIGATVEIRCPDACSEMAMVAGHESVVSLNFFRHIDTVFPELFWTGYEQRLRVVRIEKGGDDYWFPLARGNKIFRGWTDEDILQFVPRTCHENRIHMTVAKSEFS